MWFKVLYYAAFLAVTKCNMAPAIYDSIVVGMGASGVTALSSLAKAGRSVLGLEAASYIGGRVKTVQFGKGVVELGAEWIHGERPSKVFDLATNNHIPIVMQDLHMDMFRSDGTVCDRQQMTELVWFCLSIVEHPPDEPGPLGEHITRKLKEHLADRPDLLNDEDFMTNFLDLMNLLVNNYESSDDWNDVSTSSKYTELDGHQHWSWHSYGYRTLFDILLNKYNNGTGLPVEIKMNTEVDNIKWSTDPSDVVIVKTKNGELYKSKNVIVTVSLGVLKERHKDLFSPKLPAAKVTAIEALTIGEMGKIILSFDTEWWPKDLSVFAFLWKREDKAKVSSEDKWVTKIYGVSRPLGSENALTLWTCGESGKLIETLPEDVVKRKCMELIRKFMGKQFVIPEPSGIVRSQWYMNPLTRGSFTYDSVTKPQFPTARFDLSTPLCDRDSRPRVLFAGEATNEYHFSTVHGAVETGLRESDRIIKYEEHNYNNTEAKSKI